jgi:hypothetical protein
MIMNYIPQICDCGQAGCIRIRCRSQQRMISIQVAGLLMGRA